MSNDRLSRIGETTQQFFDRRQSNHSLALERRWVRLILKRAGVKLGALDRGHKPEDASVELSDYMSLKWFHRICPGGEYRFFRKETTLLRDCRWFPIGASIRALIQSALVEAMSMYRERAVVLLHDDEGRTLAITPLNYYERPLAYMVIPGKPVCYVSAFSDFLEAIDWTRLDLSALGEL